MNNMENENKLDYSNEQSEDFSTGSHSSEETKRIVYPFGKYEIKVELTYSNKFVGIIEVKVNKDFLSYSQKIASTKVHDVDEFYKDEE